MFLRTLLNVGKISSTICNEYMVVSFDDCLPWCNLRAQKHDLRSVILKL